MAFQIGQVWSQLFSARPLSSDVQRRADIVTANSFAGVKLRRGRAQPLLPAPSGFYSKPS